MHSSTRDISAVRNNREGEIFFCRGAGINQAKQGNKKEYWICVKCTRETLSKVHDADEGWVSNDS